MAKSSGLTTNFLSIVFLPHVKHITAVLVPMKNKMDVALGIAIN
jgi:Ca2+/H+ antiporter